MTRLWDRVVAETAAKGVDGIEALLRIPAVYEITNVSMLWDQVHDQYRTPADFPDVAPPHSDYWMEWRCPPNDGVDAEVPQRVGLHFIVKDPGERGRSWRMEVLGVGWWTGAPVTFLRWGMTCDEEGVISFESRYVPEDEDGLMHWYKAEVRRLAKGATDEAPWKELMFRLGETKRVALGAIERGIHEIDAQLAAEMKALDGTDYETMEQVVEYTDAEIAKLHDRFDQWDAKSAELLGEIKSSLGTALSRNLLMPALLAHSLLGCRNVEVEEHSPPAALDKKHQRKRRGGQPLTKFKTLKVNVMGSRGGGGGGPGGGGAGSVDLGGGTTALHIVRGHFKTYTPERPLLGRAVGRFWWAQNVRGSADNGVVVKEYSVDAT